MQQLIDDCSAAFVQGHGFGRDRGARSETDEDEYTGAGQLLGRVGREISKPDALDAGLADDPVNHGLPAEAKGRVVGGPSDIVAPGLQAVAAMHHGDRAAEFGEMQRFLKRRVAAADHHDVLVAKQRAVAIGALGYAAARQLGFPRHAEVPQRRARGEDQSRRPISVFFRRDGFPVAVQNDSRRRFRAHLDAEVEVRTDQAGGQLRPGYGRRRRIAVQLADVDDQTTVQEAFEADHIGAEQAGVMGRGQAGDAAADDDQVMARSAHGFGDWVSLSFAVKGMRLAIRQGGKPQEGK